MSKVGVRGLWVAEAEVPRLCSFPWPADFLAAAKAPLLGDDLIFASRGSVLALWDFALLLYLHICPSSPYIVDAGYAGSPGIAHARLAASEVCDDILLLYCDKI